MFCSVFAHSGCFTLNTGVGYLYLKYALFSLRIAGREDAKITYPKFTTKDSPKKPSKNSPLLYLCLELLTHSDKSEA